MHCTQLMRRQPRKSRTKPGFENFEGRTAGLTPHLGQILCPRLNISCSRLGNAFMCYVNRVNTRAGRGLLYPKIGLGGTVPIQLVEIWHGSVGRVSWPKDWKRPTRQLHPCGQEWLLTTAPRCPRPSPQECQRPFLRFRGRLPATITTKSSCTKSRVDRSSTWCPSLRPPCFPKSMANTEEHG